jgi:hypothetical protein
MDLDALRKEQRSEAELYLIWVGVDSEQLKGLVLGSPQQQHNVVRLAYVLSEDPALEKLREQYAKESQDREEALTFEGVAKKVRNELKNYIYKCKEDRRQPTKPDAPMQYIDHVHYDRAMGAAEISIDLISRMLKSMEPQKPSS